MISMHAFSGAIRIRDGFQPRPGITHALFDFDGTLSIIRQGWPDVMLPMFLEMLPRKPEETDDTLRAMLFDDIMRLNGKQTIYQMIQFAERIRERGGTPQEPLWYKHEYLSRLNQRIGARLTDLKSGRVAPDEHLVFGSRQLLQALRSRGFTLYLASGTDEVYVKQEAALLGVTEFFGQHIYGAQDDYRQFSKKMVIERIIRENRISGANLLSFGDGYVEIENTKQAGGLAVAVASDEAHNGSGEMDPWKMERLWGVGADVVIPDYRDTEPLLGAILS